MKQNKEYFGAFPLLEGLILFRYKSVKNFAEKEGFTQKCVQEYLLGRAKPPYAFIVKCLKIFNEYPFELLFKENEMLK